MTNVRQPQQVNAYFRSEDTYASIGKESQAAGALSHIGLLDTFDPRMLDHQYAAVSTIGYSVAPHVLKGATNVMVPLKIGCWGDGWKTLLGRCIGQSTIASAARPAYLRPDVQTVAILAEEQLASTFQCSLASGVAFNKAELELDYTTNAPATINFDATAYYVVDRDANASRTTARDFTTGDSLFIQSNFSAQSIPSEPTTDPILPADVTIQYATAATNGVTITNSAAANTYYEVGERFLIAYDAAGALDSNFGTSGVYDLTDSSFNTIANINGDIDGDTNYTFAEGSASGNTVNLLKGVYKNGSTIKLADSMTDWPFVKTAKLTIDNQHIPLPGVATGRDSGSTKKILQNNDVARGESIIQLEITSTAKDETFYDKMVAGTELPLVRLDFGTNGSIALTNGKIMTRTAGYTAGTEVTETVTMQFYGAGDYTNYSKYAISGDF
tara:strand:- start:1680 stop:3008 length:1329 start_codon:yes stop_codon:yes gene_type:complete